MKVCKIVGCNLKVKSRGWCGKHYQRWWAHGDPTYTIYGETPQESFEYKVYYVTETGCLLWAGATTGKDSSGIEYGQIWDGVKRTTAHRFAWEQENGEIPDGYEVDHKLHCSTLCCNTEHLRLATKSQNKMNFSGSPSTNTSGHRNVSWDTATQKWYVAVGGRYVGRYTDKKEAAKVAEQARLELFGVFAGKGYKK